MKLLIKTLLLALLSAAGSNIAYCSGSCPIQSPGKNPDSVQRDGPGTLPTWPNKTAESVISYCEGPGTLPTWPN